MKKLYSIFLLASALLVTSCGEDSVPVNGYIETTQDNAETLVLKGYESSADGFSVCQPEGFASPFYIQEKSFVGSAYNFIVASAKRLDEMTTAPEDAEWASSVPVTDRTTYWVRYVGETAYHFMKMRVVRIEGNEVSIEYVVTDQVAEIPNVNANSGYNNISVTAYEMPHLNADYVYVDHYVKVGEADVLNYAFEWCPDKKHSNWVAFSFDETTCKDNVSRTDAWDVDPNLPEDMRTDNSFHTNDGFDRGHICASEDRVYSEDANKQTFYFSNMSPQFKNFNQKFWAGLEKQVQSWGRSIPNTYDKVYVTKGGTMNQLLVNYTGTIKGADGKYPTTDANGFTIKGLACPAYYFMAVLSEKGGVFHAIGFLVPHQEDMSSPSVEEMQGFVVSIDELEEATGIDFFCNLPDATENAVEAAFNLDDWVW
nr:DNA/RNA non-specific endonuclease [uncultured Bacteroides sp.]